MAEFNDLNNIIVFYMRKIKCFIAIVLAGCVIFAGMRCVETVPKYLNQDKNPQKTTETTKTTSGEPVYKNVDVLLRVEPVINENGDDITQYIISSYVANKTNSEVINQLMDQYLEAEKNDNKANRELLYAYGYILDKERNYTYSETDFVNQLRVYECSDNPTNNYVGIGFSSMNEERAREIAQAYEKILTQEVKKQIGEFEYEVESEKIEYKLPTPSAGASPTRVVNTAAASSTNTVISLSSVIKDIIKGTVWGFLLGFVAAVLILGLWYLTSTKIQKLADMKKYDVRLYGVYTDKKRIFKFWHKIIYNLEGEKRVFDKTQKLADVILASLESSDVEGTVMVAGSAEEKKVRSLYKALAKSEKIHFIKGNYILSDAESIRACSKCDQVILVEEMGKSVKEDIRREIDVYSGYHVNVLGVAISE
nr:hypothetical protein [uncultured Sellimonas sp.]